jgi:hypothetical protein
MKIASAACEENFIALRQAEGGCSDGRMFDVYGSEEGIGCWMCGRLDVMQVQRRCRSGGEQDRVFRVEGEGSDG